MPCFSVVSKPVQYPANHESSNKNINKRYSQLAFLYDKLNLAGDISFICISSAIWHRRLQTKDALPQTDIGKREGRKR